MDQITIITIFTLITISIIILVDLYLYVRYSKICFLYWGITWLFQFIQFYISSRIDFYEIPLGYLILFQFLLFGQGLLSVWALYLFLELKPSKSVKYLTLAFLLLSILNVVLFEKETIVQFGLVLTTTFKGIFYMWWGILFYRKYTEIGFGAKTLVFSHILYGLHQVDYPIFYFFNWNLVYGYFIADFLQLLIGVSLLIVFYEKIEEDIKEMEKNRMINQRMESIGRLAGGIAHDFNNILTGVMGNISLAQIWLEKRINANIKPELKSKLVYFLKEGKKSCDQAKMLSNQLLTFSKGGEPIKTKLNVLKVLNDTIKRAVKPKDVQLIKNITQKELISNIDPVQISQVFQNVIQNAYDALEGKGASKNGKKYNLNHKKKQNDKKQAQKVLQISVETVSSEEIHHLRALHLKEKAKSIFLPYRTQIDKDRKYLRIVFMNNGPPIPQKSLEKIFDLFYSTKAQGNGIGLPISYSIIKKHNGMILVQSNQQKTSFNIILPLPKSIHSKKIGKKEAQEKKIISAKRKMIPREKEQKLKEQKENILQKKILPESPLVIVIDDEKGIRNMVSVILGKLGFQVITCSDSSTFFKKVESLYKKNKNIGFYLIDYVLSEDINGKELLKRLKRKYPDKDIKSIVFSGYVDNDYMNNYRRYGFIGAIEKPFTYFSMKKKLKEIFTANNVENVRNL